MLVEALSLRGDSERSLELLHEMENRNRTTGTVTYSVVINGLAKVCRRTWVAWRRREGKIMTVRAACRKKFVSEVRKKRRQMEMKRDYRTV